MHALTQMCTRGMLAANDVIPCLPVKSRTIYIIIETIVLYHIIQVFLFGQIFHRGSIDVLLIPPIDVDGVGGDAWYRNEASPNTRDRVLSDIRRVYPSVPHVDNILIATWDRVHLLSQSYQV